MIRAALAIALTALLWCGAQAQWSGGPHYGNIAGFSAPIAAGSGGSASYAFVGFCTFAGSGTVNSCTPNMGTNANCFVIVAAGGQNGTAVNSIKVGTTTLSSIVLAPTTNALSTIYGGTLTGNCSGMQTVAADIAGTSFTDKGLAIWTTQNLMSTTALGTCNATNSGATTTCSPSLSVSAGNFIFAYNVSDSTGGGAATTYATSTQPATRQDTPQTPSGGSSFYFTSGDWITTCTTCSIVVSHGGTVTIDTVVAASFH